MTLCAVCGRDSRGFGYAPRLAGATGRPGQACSMECLDLLVRRQGMVDYTRHEIEAMQAASAPAGDYLERVGKTDLAALSCEEWMTFIETVCSHYHASLRELSDSGEPPF